MAKPRDEFVNQETGEILVPKKIGKFQSKETFFFVRTTDGIKWTKDLVNSRDTQLIYYMIYYHEKNNFVWFSPTAMKECAEFYEVDYRTVSNSIKSLVKGGFLKNVGAWKYIINPSRYYNGGSQSYGLKIKLWEAIK